MKEHFGPVETLSRIITPPLITERTDAIQRELENRLDGSLMLWCDVDIAFYRDCAGELERLAEGKDLLLQT